MSDWRIAHAWRVLGVVCCLAGAGLPALAAGPDSARLPELADNAAEPFGGPTSPLFESPLNDKWRAVGREIDDEMVVIALCQENRAVCPSAAALRFLAIVDKATQRDGRARIGEINRAINLAIRPVSDLALYGVDDVWRSPLATLAKGAGDCEDYAIAKLVALRVAGIEPDDLRLTILHDVRRAQDHAVVSVRLDGHWLVLDNQRLVMREDTAITSVLPIVSIDRGGVRRYLNLESAMPPRAAMGSS